jgi:phage tail sheath gpL-like
VKSSYRVLCVCYHGAIGQEAELAGAMAAALADSNDPALPFDGVNLGGITLKMNTSLSLIVLSKH